MHEQVRGNIEVGFLVTGIRAPEFSGRWLNGGEERSVEGEP